MAEATGVIGFCDTIKYIIKGNNIFSMKRRLASFFLFSSFLFSFFLSVLPIPAEAALVVCGRSTGTAEEKAPCTICHLIVGGKGVIDYGLGLMTFAAMAIMVAMAIFYIVSAGDEGMMSTAKSGIKAALIGMVVMLTAWLMVSVVLGLLAKNGTVAGLTNAGGVFKVDCDTTSLMLVP